MPPLTLDKTLGFIVQYRRKKSKKGENYYAENDLQKSLRHGNFDADQEGNVWRIRRPLRL